MSLNSEKSDAEYFRDLGITVSEPAPRHPWWLTPFWILCGLFSGAILSALLRLGAWALRACGVHLADF